MEVRHLSRLRTTKTFRESEEREEGVYIQECRGGRQWSMRVWRWAGRLVGLELEACRSGGPSWDDWLGPGCWTLTQHATGKFCHVSPLLYP